MKRKNQILPLVLCLLLVSSCKDAAIRKAARASDDMAQTISLAIDTKRGLYQQGLIAAEEELQLTLALKKTNDAVTIFNKRAQTLYATNGSKGQLLMLFKQLSESVAELNQKDVLSIKNEQAQAKLKTVLSALDLSLQIIQGALERVQT